jgi:penicillin-binding protein 2
MAGKTGTAQVVGLNFGNGKNVPWKYRDHGHFICFAPFDKPRYACAVVVEHGGGSGAAYPIARDVMTFLFDPAKAMDALLPMEAEWGGTPQQRMAARYAAYEAQYGINAPRAAADAGVKQAEDRADEAGTPPQPMETAAASPPPEEPMLSPPPSPSPSASSAAQRPQQ